MTAQRTGSQPGADRQDTHLLVVIDHREARIYRAELRGSVPQRIHAVRSARLRTVSALRPGTSPTASASPERKTFYEAVANTLRGAEKILLFGSGTGASSAMDQLLADLKRRHPPLAQRVVGSIVVDEQHSTEDQLLAKAREFYAKLASEETTAGPRRHGSPAA